MNVDKLCVSCMGDDSGSPTCPKCGALFDLPHNNLLLLPPRMLLHQQYIIGRALGHGGFGVTYLAWDTGLQIRLAIKEYMPSGVASRSTPHTVHASSERMKDEYEWGLDRFLEEARVLKKFSTHPNIVAVDTIFRDNGTAYMVMEYLEGMTFEEFVAQRGGKVSFETSLRVMVPVIDTLATVHGEGILHRDISPDNIHIGKTGKVKLMDFGAARNALSQKSRNLSVILKEGYAPEEQYRSSGIQGPWTDVYATGATLYHSITGKLPPPALDRAAEDNIETPSQLGVEIPPRSERALMKALAVRSLERYQSMEDFKDGLTEPATTSAPVPPPMVQAPVASSSPGLPPGLPPALPPTPTVAPPQPPPISQQMPVAPPPVPAPPSQQFQPPLPYQNVPIGPAPTPTPPPTSRKWLIPVAAIGLILLAAAAAITLKFGPDLLAKFSNKDDSVAKNQPPSSPPPADPVPVPAPPPQASAPQPDPAPASPPPASPAPAHPAPTALPPATPPRPAPKAVSQKPSSPPPPVQTDEDRQHQLEQQKSVAPAPAPRPPVAPANPTSGVLRYAGPPVPLNGKVTFQNLPAARLRFTFDHDAWQPIISRQANGSQTLVLVSKKQGLQSKCEVRWEVAP